MKRYLATILIAYVLLLSSCKPEPDYVRDYPQLLSSEIVSTTTKGVSVTATMSEFLMGRVTDHGFTWVQDSPFTSNQTVFSKSFGKPSNTTFSTDITTQLLAGKPYILKAYLKTETITVYGIPIPFTSLGSEGPVIESMSPSVVAPKDLLTIKGRGFGTELAKIKVNLIGPQTNAPAKVKTLSDAEMVIEVPDFIDQSVKVLITLPGAAPTTSSVSVNRKLPKITGISSSDICSPIVIGGEDLLTLGAGISITVNSVPFYFATITATSITLPAELHSPTLNTKFSFPGGYTIASTFTDPVKMPVVTSTAPAIIGESESFVLTGTDFPTKCGSLGVSGGVANNQLQIIKSTATEITVQVMAVGCDPFKIYLSHNGIIFYVSDPVKPRDFTVSSIGPDIGKIGDPVLVYGTELSNVEATMGEFPFNSTTPGASVYLPYVGGDKNKQTFMIQAPEVIDNLPRTPDGATSITVSKCGQSKSFWYKLEIPDFTIIDFVVKSAVHPITMTINGTNFPQGMNVYLLDINTGSRVAELPIVKITSTQIDFIKIPLTPVNDGDYKLAVEWLGRQRVFASPIQMSLIN